MLRCITLLVCSMLGAVAACHHYDDDPALVDLSSQPVRYEGDDTVIVGRSQLQDDQTQLLTWAGSSLQTRFSGASVTAAISLLNGEGISAMQVVLDGNDGGIVPITYDTSQYTISADGDGPHTLEIYKLTESIYGDWKFGGFTPTDGGALLPTALPSGRRFLFIGDSVACGYGNLGVITTEMLTSSLNADANTQRDCNYFIGEPAPALTSAYQAFGAMAARDMNAQWQQICWSGLGVYRNADGSTTGTIPEIWQRTVADDATTKADLSQFVPQVVLVNAGTNDFGSIAQSSLPGGGPPNLALFDSAYLGMLKQVRAAWPNAWIFVSVGPLLSDYYPTTFQALSTMRTTIHKIIKKFGDGRTRYFEFPVNIQSSYDATGCEWHPDLSQDANMAKLLRLTVQDTLGWR